MFLQELSAFWMSDVRTIAAILGAILAIYFIHLVMKSNRPKGLPPGPPVLPIVGSVPFLKENAGDFYKEFTRLAEQYGSVFSFPIGPTWIVVLNDFKAIKEAFVTQSIAFAGRTKSHLDYMFFKNLPIKGIVSDTYSAEWGRQRNTALILLRKLGMGRRGVEERIVKERDELLQVFAAKDAHSINPEDKITTSVANVICSLLFAETYKQNDPDFVKLIAALRAVLAATADASASDHIPFISWLPGYKKMLHLVKANNDTIYNFLMEKIAVRTQRRLSVPADIPQDFIESYLEELENVKAGKARISQDWLEDIAFDFFAAGVDTTSTTLTWALLYMVRNPTVQDKVQLELDSVLGSPSGRGLTRLEHRGKLPYTEATIMEVQRMSAILATAIVHCTTCDVQFRGWHLPKDTQVRVNLYGVLHDPSYWKDPEEFRPDRFIDSDGKVIKEERWIPFGMGRRMCLGEQLARQELFLFFSGILHSFKIVPPEGSQLPSQDPIGGLILKCQPYHVRLIPRFRI